MANHAVLTCRKHDSPDSKPGKRIFEILARHASRKPANDESQADLGRRRQRDSNGQYMFNMKELVDNYGKETCATSACSPTLNLAVTFLVAGGDPTAHTITFAIYEILQNPDVMAKLRAELDSVIPADCITPSIEQVKLPYLNRVIKETLRMHGPGFGTFRFCREDTEVDGVVLPANTTLALWNPQGVQKSQNACSRRLTQNSAPRPECLGPHRQSVQPRSVGRRQRSTEAGIVFPLLIRAPELPWYVS